jgi:hypothetical protein
MTRSIRLFYFCLALFFANSASAGLELPKNLSQGDRVTALQILGFGTSSKLLTDPYPLGGYAGFEAGFSLENVPTDEIGRLGTGLKPPQQDVTLPKLTVGKGLYNNIDIFAQFTPYSRADEVAQYGGIVRWNFYQASSLPLSVSALAHVNNANISNEMTTNVYGLDLVGGINVENLSLFAGMGLAEGSATFIGGSASVTDSKLQESEFVSGVHTFAGADIHFSNVFVALEIDRYLVPVFCGKLGVRF